MKVINLCKNTIYVEDIDFHIPYSETAIDIDSELIKKSRGLRNVIISNSIEIVEYDPAERIENSIVYIKNKQSLETPEAIPEDSSPEILEPELNSVTDDIEVKLHGIFYDASGYAKVNRNIAKRLFDIGIKIKVDAKFGRNQLTEKEISEISHLEKTQISRNHILIDSIVPSFAEFGTGKYKVLYTTIESYTIPKQFMDSCSYYDEIWLTSPWSAELLKSHLPNKPIYAIPTGVDPGLYREDGLSFDLGSSVKKFIFVSVFSWNYRKGWDALIRAYLDEFSDNDDVTLMLVTRYQSGKSRHEREKPKEDIDKIMSEFPNKDLPHLVRYGKIIREEDMPKIYRSANCFVLPTRGEGGGLPPLEASLCGLPVIMTNCSGQQMYLRENNSYMLEIDRLETMAPGKMHIHYWDGQKFPSLTSPGVIAQLKSHMRSVFSNYEAAKSRNKNLQKMIMEKFTWNHTVNLIAERLKCIKTKMEG